MPFLINRLHFSHWLVVMWRVKVLSLIVILLLLPFLMHQPLMCAMILRLRMFQILQRRIQSLMDLTHMFLLLLLLVIQVDLVVGETQLI